MEDAKLNANVTPLEAVVLPDTSGYKMGGERTRRMSQMSASELSENVRSSRSGTLTVEEAEAVVRNLSKRESETQLADQRTKTYKYVSLVTAFAAVVMVIVMLSVNLAANEISKDTKPNKETGTLMTYDGKAAVKTADVQITHGLFDLPKLSIDSLKEVKTITLILENKEEWLVQVQSVAKTPCSTTAVFYGNNAAVHVDTRQTAAYAVIRDGEKHLITGSTVNRALAESRGLAYTEAGFASLAMDKMAEYEDQAACEGVTLAETGLFGTGSVTVNGETSTIFFSQDANSARETLITNADGSKNLYANNMSFHYNSVGMLTECRWGLNNNQPSRATDATNAEPVVITFDSPQQLTPSNVKPYTVPSLADCKAAGAIVQSQAGAAAWAAANPNRRLLAERGNQEQLAAIRAGGEAGARAYHEINMAQLDEEIASVEEGSDHHRSLLEHRSLASKAGKMMADAYKNCQFNGNNGQACGYEDNCMFAFRGSNAPTSWDGLQDWWANIFEAFTSTTKYGGKRMHGGFVGELDKILGGSGGLAGRISACGSSATFVGHSLGGAIAVVAREYHGSGTVMTFGAPAVYKYAETCNVNGYRMMHEGDPVPLLASVAGYDHGRTKTTYEIDNYCAQRNQICIPYPCSCGWRGCRTCHSCHDTTCRRYANRRVGKGCRDTPSTCGWTNLACVTTVASHGSDGYKEMSV